MKRNHAFLGTTVFPLNCHPWSTHCSYNFFHATATVQYSINRKTLSLYTDRRKKCFFLKYSTSITLWFYHFGVGGTVDPIRSGEFKFPWHTYLLTRNYASSELAPDLKEKACIIYSPTNAIFVVFFLKNYTIYTNVLEHIAFQLSTDLSASCSTCCTHVFI